MGLNCGKGTWQLDSLPCFPSLLIIVESALRQLRTAGELHCLCISQQDGGNYAASVGADSTLRLFDVRSFDMAALVKLEFVANACEFVYQKGAPTPLVAVYVPRHSARSSG